MPTEPSCLFCKIVAKQIPARIVHEDADTLAFDDINPVSPQHVLVITKKHIATANDITAADEALAGKLFTTAAKVAKARGFADEGWRAVMNVGQDAHQLVFHIHLHVIAGRPMKWPPG